MLPGPNAAIKVPLRAPVHIEIQGKNHVINGPDKSIRTATMIPVIDLSIVEDAFSQKKPIIDCLVLVIRLSISGQPLGCSTDSRPKLLDDIFFLLLCHLNQPNRKFNSDI